MSDIVSISSLNHALAGSQVQLDHARAASDATSADSSRSGPVESGQDDSVALSGAAGLVQQAQNAGSADRASRVQQLKQQIESGQYTIDPAAIGNAIINAGTAGE
jgi:flagellar biosynthesis anti-sigma factor FlgM